MPESAPANAARWYYGWNIVAAASLITLLTVGMRMGVGPFFLPVSEDLGFSRSVLSSIVAVGMLCYGLAMPAAGYMVSRFGTKPVLLLGTSVVVLSSIWSVLATGYWSFFFSYGVFLSAGLGFTSPVAMTPIIAKWFTRLRGMALFFLSTGSMAGIAIMTPVFTVMIESLGWRWTMVAYGTVFVVVALPLILWVIREDAPAETDTRLAGADKSPAKAKQSPPLMHLSVMQVLKTKPYWQVFIGLFACGFSMNLLGTHGVPMLVDHCFTPMTASGGIGMIGLVAIFSTVLLGRISDRMPKHYLLAIIYFVRGLGFIGLLMVMTPLELYVVAAIGGIVWAGSLAMSSAILADIYGVRLVGVLYGWAYLGHQVGAMISSWFGGWGYEVTASHWPAFGAAAILLFIGAAVSLTLPVRRPPSLVRQPA